MVQRFVWRKNNSTIALMEVRHSKYEILVDVVCEIAEKTRTKMEELNEGGMYPNQETSTSSYLSIQFIVSVQYNWNSRWRDFKKILDQVFETGGQEVGKERY